MTGPDSEPKLGAEDRAENANADDSHDVGSALRPVKTRAALWIPEDAFRQVGGIFTVDDHQIEAEAHGEHRNDTAECEDAKAPQLRHGRSTDDMDLRDQRQLDEDEDQCGHDAVCNGDPHMLAQTRGAILLQRDEDKVQERTGHLGALDGAADDVADEGENVEDPRQTAAFGSLSHKQQDKKQDCGGSKLNREDDCGAYGGQPDIVDVNGAERCRQSFSGNEGEGLVVDIEASREDDRHDLISGQGVHLCRRRRCHSFSLL